MRRSVRRSVRPVPPPFFGVPKLITQKKQNSSFATSTLPFVCFSHAKASNFQSNFHIFPCFSQPLAKTTYCPNGKKGRPNVYFFGHDFAKHHTFPSGFNDLLGAFGRNLRLKKSILDKFLDRRGSQKRPLDRLWPTQNAPKKHPRRKVVFSSIWDGFGMDFTWFWDEFRMNFGWILNGCL